MVGLCCPVPAVPCAEVAAVRHYQEKRPYGHLVGVGMHGQLNYSTIRNYGSPEPSGKMDDHKAAAADVGRHKKEVQAADVITYNWSCMLDNSMRPKKEKRFI